jgi:hypothetical protein
MIELPVVMAGNAGINPEPPEFIPGGLYTGRNVLSVDHDRSTNPIVRVVRCFGCGSSKAEEGNARKRPD